MVEATERTAVVAVGTVSIVTRRVDSGTTEEEVERVAIRDRVTRPIEGLSAGGVQSTSTIYPPATYKEQRSGAAWYNRGMKDFDDFRIKLGPVFQEYGVKKALLFGSFAKGEETVKSDVDLCVDSGLRGMKFVGLIEAVRRALGGKEVDVLNVSHFEDGSKVADEIKQTGVVIYEGF